LEVPAPINEYANKSLSKLYTPTPKRIATEMEDDPEKMDSPAPVTPAPRSVTTQSHQGTTSWSSHSQRVSPIQTLQQTSQLHNNMLRKLESCCVTLSDTTSRLATQMQNMNESFNQRFDTLSNAIDRLANSPSRRQSKLHKDHHGPPDVHLRG
jgi:hypothetical protein